MTNWMRWNKATRIHFVNDIFAAIAVFICWSSLISSLILWHPVGKVHLRELTYPEAIASDSGLDTRDLSSAMVNSAVWEAHPLR